MRCWPTCLGWQAPSAWPRPTINDHNRFLLELHLEACVPLRIAELTRRGGPGEADLDRVRGYVVPADPVGEDGALGLDSLLCAGAEAILFRTQPAKSAEWVTKLVDALAVMSFCPGGVSFLGRRWQSSSDNGD